jgi:hypothetical protein
MRHAVLAIVLAAALWSAVPCQAGLSDEELKQANKMVQRTLYLRIDLPCEYFYRYPEYAGRVRPLIEVSPTAVREHSARPDHLSSDITWRFGPNSPVRYGKVYNYGDGVDVWMEGPPPNNDQMIARFVDINAMGDFKAAFDRTFSLVPLQDEHPEWPPDIRNAIADALDIGGKDVRVFAEVHIAIVEHDGCHARCVCRGQVLIDNAS